MNDQDLNNLLTAAQALLNDIEAMRQEDSSWYGPFINFTDCSDEYDVDISWPNLEISAANVRDAMNELKKEEAA